MIKVIICGIGGRIGHAILNVLSTRKDIECVAGIDVMTPDNVSVPVFKNFKDCNVAADIVIDFSRPDALTDILSYAESKKCAVVLATTGHTPEQKKAIQAASKKIPVFMSSNMSLGISLLNELAKKAAQFLGDGCDISIIEQHHKMKVDAPSGTALSLAGTINNVLPDKKIDIHAVRGGNIVGKHDVLYIGSEEIITLSHDAQSRNVFAVGAVRAAEFIADKPAGLYSMSDLIGQAWMCKNCEYKPK